MKYKLLCTDLDGTLLTDDKKIRESDRAALRQVSEQGMKIALVTSRADRQRIRDSLYYCLQWRHLYYGRRKLSLRTVFVSRNS